MAISIFYVVVLITLSTTLANQSLDSLVPENVNRKSEDKIPADGYSLSPFATTVYKLATSSGIFEKLFHLSIEPSDAASAFYNAAIYLGENFRAPDVGQLPLKVAQSIKDVFEKGLTPFDYFRSFVTADEDYFRYAGILTPENEELLANSYVQAIRKKLKSIGQPETAQAYIYALTIGAQDFMKSFDISTPSGANYILIKYIEELNRIQQLLSA